MRLKLGDIMLSRADSRELILETQSTPNVFGVLCVLYQLAMQPQLMFAASSHSCCEDGLKSG